MKKRFLIASYFAFVGCVAAQLITPNITVKVTTVDDAGNILTNVHLKAAYQGNIRHEGSSWGEADTDTNGIAVLEGKTIWSIPITATKEGYYLSDVDVQTFVWDQEKKGNIYSDQEVIIILRPIKYPIPMYAYREIDLRLPQLSTKVGFDLRKGDWVHPYGNGTATDILWEIKGDWENFNNQDSSLILSFPNIGDGIIPFDIIQQSVFKSPYEAPLNGYFENRTWRKSRRPDPNNPRKRICIDETSHNENYIFRIGTILDATGGVKSAYYGKIYNNPKFAGATLEERYSGLMFSYYFNPTSNDRNLEYDPERNLITGLRPINQPKEP